MAPATMWASDTVVLRHGGPATPEPAHRYLPCRRCRRWSVDREAPPQRDRQINAHPSLGSDGQLRFDVLNLVVTNVDRIVIAIRVIKAGDL